MVDPFGNCTTQRKAGVLFPETDQRIFSMLNETEIKEVLRILKKEYGNTGTALKFRDPFQLLVSTMLAAQMAGQ